MGNPDKMTSKGFLDFIYEFYSSMKAHEIKLVYEGKITHQITKAFIALVEAQMEQSREEVRVQRTVFHVMVECLQNMSRHADENEAGESSFAGKGIFLVSHTRDAYCITTGNAILNDKIPELEKMIARINALDHEDLKELYKKQMRDGRLSEKGGAGLGFIDIRKKTGEPLDYHFLPISHEASFFLLSTMIPRNI
jgi:hypothetical protein